MPGLWDKRALWTWTYGGSLMEPSAQYVGQAYISGCFSMVISAFMPWNFKLSLRLMAWLLMLLGLRRDAVMMLACSVRAAFYPCCSRTWMARGVCIMPCMETPPTLSAVIFKKDFRELLLRHHTDNCSTVEWAMLAKLLSGRLAGSTLCGVTMICASSRGYFYSPSPCTMESVFSSQMLAPSSEWATRQVTISS